jgi:hypothetical protein
MFSTIIIWKDGKNVVQLIDVTKKIVAEMTLDAWLKLPAVRYAMELALEQNDPLGPTVAQ